MKRETKRVKIELLTEMLGTVAKDPEVYRSYIETKKPEMQTDEEYMTVEKIEEKGWTGFHGENGGTEKLFIYEYLVN